MDWTKIGSALLLIAMLIFIFPSMRHAVKNSPKGSLNDWLGFLGPVLAIVAFIILLISMV